MVIVKQLHYHNTKKGLSNLLGLLLLLPFVMPAHADVKFSTQMLDLDANERIDIDRFSRPGFVQPGKYNLAWRVNGQSYPENSFLIQPNHDDTGLSILCLLPEHLDKIPLTTQARKHIKLLGNPECLDWNSLPGTTYQIDINNQIIDINIPKEYLEFSEDNWDPPSLWDEGLSGVLLDY
ncbi:FimD/PapC N-terminal domain-containing protein, partial [Morganella morganii subsp. sibonii]